MADAITTEAAMLMTRSLILVLLLTALPAAAGETLPGASVESLLAAARETLAF